MAAKSGALSTAVSPVELGSARAGGGAGSWLISIKSASSLSFTILGWPADDAAFTTSDAANLAYRDLSGTSDTAGGTAITANGNYRVNSDSLNVKLVISAGTGTFTATPYIG